MLLWGGTLALVTVAAPAALGAEPAGARAASGPPVVASVHVRSPETTFQALRGFVPVQLNVQDAFKEVVGDLSKQVATTAPFDVLVALDPQAGENPERPLWAFALGIGNIEEARKIAEAKGYLQDGKPGQYRLRLPGLHCMLAGQGQSGPARLVCSERERDRDELLPYLRRGGTPVQAQNTDLHVELLLDTIVRTYQGPWQRLLQLGRVMVPQRLSSGQPAFDRAVTDATQVLIEQLGAMSRDLQTVTLDLTLQQAGAALAMSYRLSGQESWWGQANAEAASRPPAPPPTLFWALPADITSASYGTTDPKYAQRMVQLLWAVVDSFLQQDGLVEADRQALTDLILKMPKWQGPLSKIFAEGPADVRPDAKGAAADDELSALLRGRFYLAASDGPDDQSVAWLRALVAAWNRPGLQAYLRKKWKALNIPTPLQLKLDPTVKGLAAGAVAVAATLNLGDLGKLGGSKAAAAKPSKPITFYMISAPVGGKTWTALGTDKATLVRRLGDQAQPAPEKTLASRPGLEALREPGLLSGGFATLAGFGGLLDAGLSAAQRGGTSVGKRVADPKLHAAALLSAIPHHGEVPMTYGGRTALSGAGSSGTTESFTLRVPRLVIEDMVALVMHLALRKDKAAGQP
ncbi:MAG: hypothetical protein U1A78_28070 [Polyangia bacterium]